MPAPLDRSRADATPARYLLPLTYAIRYEHAVPDWFAGLSDVSMQLDATRVDDDGGQTTRRDRKAVVE